MLDKLGLHFTRQYPRIFALSGRGVCQDSLLFTGKILELDAQSRYESFNSSEDEKMAISQRFKRLFQRITSDSVSCGTLALWAVAMGSLLVIMQFSFKNQLL